MKRPTQQDVARLAGVSRATVSYVINGTAKGPIHISDETREKILHAAQILGYEPDSAAQSLRSQKSRTVGVLLPDLFNPHYWQILRGVENELHQHDYDLLLMSTSLDPERERSALRTLLRRRVDGLILSINYVHQEQQEIQTIIQRREPVVIFAAAIPELDSVNPLDDTGSRDLYRHLYDLGHRRIGLIHGVARPPIGAGRLDTYRRFIAANVPELGDGLVEMCGPTIADGYSAARRLLLRDPRPTALVVINDLLAIGAMHALAEAGLRIPEDISVAGYDDIDPAAYLNPALTTVKLRAEEMGSSAARLLFERMADPNRPPQHLDLPAVLIPRGSTGPVNEELPPRPFQEGKELPYKEQQPPAGSSPPTVSSPPLPPREGRQKR